MCLHTSPVRPYQKWNWNGSEIVHDTAIPASRKLTRKNKIIKKFPVDIREFLTIENNAVISKLIGAMVKELPDDEQVKFYKNDKGNFDFRVRKCQEFMKHITYVDANSKYDEWQFPEETWELKSGDCEDVAFILASVLSGCNISDYCIRVALGKVINHAEDHQQWEHAWVMYQNEAGVWEIIEPLLFVKQALTIKSKNSALKKFNPAALDIEYLPYYVFNKEHLWRVRNYDPVIKQDFTEYLISERNYFNKFNPGFAANVHNTIYHEALKEMSWVNRQVVIATSLYIDVNTVAYDPRDHFDFAYIDEGWQRVEKNLSTGKLTDFALAVHAIGDFYAHSYYGYFMLKTGKDKIPVYDPRKPLPAAALKYDFSALGELPGCDPSKWKKGTKSAEQLWQGKLISGQWWRWFAAIPDELQNSADFARRRCLPDHDAVAVDSQSYDPDKHKLFKTPEEYQRQYQARVNAAIEHIKQVYRVWKQKK